MGDCKPPLADIRNCNHRRREPSLDENGIPRSQCGMNEKAIDAIERGDWDQWKNQWKKDNPDWLTDFSEPSIGWWGVVDVTGGLTHTRKWESKSSNRRRTLRIDEKVLDWLSNPKKAKQKWGVNDLGIETRGKPKGQGRTGILFRKRGRPASGNPHLMRAQTLRVLKEDIGMIVKLLEKATAENWKPGKKKDVVLHMPNMELAMEDLLKELNEYVNENEEIFEGSFEAHPLLSRNHAQSGWAPTLCRLIEIRAMYGVEVRAEVLAQERLVEFNNPEYETKEEELYEGLGVGVFPSRKTSKN